MVWTCPETDEPCERMCLTACHIRSAELVVLRAEVERLREAGVGYSQQTVDAITKERDALRARVAELEKALGAMLYPALMHGREEWPEFIEARRVLSGDVV